MYLLRYIHSLFVKIWYNRACSSLYILLCPDSVMNSIKTEYLISQVEYMSFEHEMVELVRAPNFPVASDVKTLVCGFKPRYRLTLISHIHSLHLKSLVTTVEFQLHPPSHCHPQPHASLPSLHLLSHSNMRK